MGIVAEQTFGRAEANTFIIFEWYFLFFWYCSNCVWTDSIESDSHGEYKSSLSLISSLIHNLINSLYVFRSFSACFLFKPLNNALGRPWPSRLIDIPHLPILWRWLSMIWRDCIKSFEELIHSLMPQFIQNDLVFFVWLKPKIKIKFHSNWINFS